MQNKRHIIIEGIDKTGKSTLAKYLSKKFNLPIKKFSAPDGNPYNDYLDFIKNETKPHIIDRFYLGELVYGPVKRGKSWLTPENVKTLELECFRQETFNILTDADIQITGQRFIQEKENFLQQADIEPIMRLYRETSFYSRLIWTPYRIDGDYGLEKMAEFYISHCKGYNNE